MTRVVIPRDRRELAVEVQVAARGVRDPAVLEAMIDVPREAFVPARLSEFAYEDAPLPIEEGQTISQPFIVALMTEALQLRPGARVLEVGTGSGYAAAVLSRVAAEVFTVERHEALAESARQRLSDLGYDNIRVLHGDGTLGWPEHAPYDAIVVAAGGPDAPAALLEQLAIGGRLVIPVGPTQREQSLVRITRISGADYAREDLGGVRFVPLVGEQGWKPEGGSAAVLPPAAATPAPAPRAPDDRSTSILVREAAEPLGSIDGCDLSSLMDRISDARVVLLGEATHGTSEFYRMRARITRELVERKGFDVIAVEADWPDASRIDRYVRELPPGEDHAFTRFPQWMWRNVEVREFVEWLRSRNAATRDPSRRVGFHGLDLYSLHASIDAVLRYLDDVDPGTARLARSRYGCLTPWQSDPAAYGRAAITGTWRSCEPAVVAMLGDLLARRLAFSARDGERFFDAARNAKLIASAEAYYRVMYEGSVPSWNLRDRHMFETLESLLAFRGEDSRAVIWAHNSHVGNAAATEMGVRGELNVGQLCRERFGDAAYAIGFGTDHGTVAAATHWGDRMEIKRVRPSHPRSYERLSHDSGVEAFLLPLRHPRRAELRDELLPPRLERAIGVIYRPETELASHYFQAVLPLQFDEWIWFDETRAVTPTPAPEPAGWSQPHPFDAP